MSVVVLVTMLGAAWPVLFRDGSALAKNLEKRVWVEAVDDQAVAATMEAELYGEEPPAAEISTHDPGPRIEFVRKADRISAILCILIAATIRVNLQDAILEDPEPLGALREVRMAWLLAFWSYMHWDSQQRALTRCIHNRSGRCY